MEKIVFIINPAAGKGKGVKSNLQIRDYLKRNSIEAEIILTKKPKHATAIAEQLSPDFERVISVGGDGTLNEIINGLSLSTERKIGILPIGSGNDFAAAINMGKNFSDSLKILLSDKPKLQTVDIGQIEFSDYDNADSVFGNRFVNSLGFGFDAYVAYLNQTNKKLRGIASYVLAVIKAMKSFKSAEIEYLIDNLELVSGKKLLLAIGNGKTTGGGFYLTPDAEIDDEFFDLCAIDDVSNFKLLQSLPKALINKIKGVPEVNLSKFKTLKVSVKNVGFFVHCDGENISRNVKSADITILNHNLKFIIG